MIIATVEVSLYDFSDSDVVDYIVHRRLVHQVVEADAARRKEKRSAMDDADDAYAALLSRRLDKAVEHMRCLIEQTVSADLLAAYEAARDGRRDDAICRLDAYLHVATPMKEAT